ncbi:MAG: proton-conducting transporter membrane subunit [Acetobacteraceae bacterium]|nr:proton-conducting transporter membrane subunit [Acetobacteraceae bacterium]
MLTALASGVGLLLLLAAAAVPSGRDPRAGAAVHAGCLGVSAGFAVLAVLSLLAGLPEGLMALPFGPPWGAVSLALDGLSAWFLLLLGVVGACASLFALGAPPRPARSLSPLPLMLAGTALALAAADAFLMLLGLGLAVAAAVEPGRSARLHLILAALAAGCLVLALGLLAGPAGAYDFAAMRAVPPEGWRAGAVLALGLLGAAALAGLLRLAPSAVPLSGLALYVMARLLVDLCGSAQPSWWGVPLLAVGGVAALAGAMRAIREEDSKALLASAGFAHTGLAVMGLGLLLAFRGADLGALAGLAAGAALLHALNQGVAMTLLVLAAGAVAHAAGSRMLDRLGGLIHAMPVTAACALTGMLAASCLPPLSGFAGAWLLLQAVLAGWRVGSIGLQLVAAAATVLAGLTLALTAAAMLRLFGLAFLGRPRSPRGAGAHEVSRSERWAMILPAGLTLLLGLLPGPMLVLAGPALGVLTGRAAAPVRDLTLLAGDQPAAYAPLAMALVLALFGGGLAWLVRRRAPLPAARGPVWDGGFMAPPDYLPFGDPLTQPSAAGMAEPLRRMLGEPRAPRLPWDAATRLREWLAGRLERLPGLTLRQGLSLGFGALILLLLLLLLWSGRR